jgi:hypothetical protein
MGRVQAMGVAASLVLAVGCGGPGGGAAPSEVTIRGVAFSDHRVDLPCDEQAEADGRPEELSGIELRLSDGDGKPLGYAVTGPLEWAPLDYGCRFFAAYSVALPAAPAYRVEFDPPAPREFGGGYFEGAELLEPQEISHEGLRKAGFEWNFEAEPSYVVP